MSDTNIPERDQDADTLALNGLSQKDRDETQEILDEIDSQAPKTTEPTDEAKKPEEKPEVEKPEKSEEKPEEDKDSKNPPARREAKLMPAWLHERAKADWAKRESELLQQVEQASKEAIEKKGDGKATVDSVDNDVKLIAEKHDISEDLAKDLVEAAIKRAGVIPPELSEKLKQIDQLNEAKAIETELTSFNADFNTQIIPLIKAEYGDDVDPEIVERIREDFKEKAYTPEYAKVPYKTIYKGEDQFRDVIPPKKKGAESSRGGSTAAAEMLGEEAVDLTKPLSDDAISKLAAAEFETYCKNMESYERSQKR